MIREHRVVSEVDRVQAEQILSGSTDQSSPKRQSAARKGTAPPLVDLREVTVRYGPVTVLDRVNLRIEPGQHWIITGPNGAGKTTLLGLILADHPQAYANHVEVLGRRRGEGEAIWETKSRIGCVSPEIHAHFPADTRVLEVVGSGFFSSIGFYAALDSAQQEQARACLERLLPGNAERALGELSYGMQRLVLIARALVTRPPLLVLDEPCQGLDAESRARVLAAIDQAVKGSETTLIYVTHQPDELPSAITHRLELKEGRVVRRSEMRERGWSEVAESVTVHP